MLITLSLFCHAAMLISRALPLPSDRHSCGPVSERSSSARSTSQAEIYATRRSHGFQEHRASVQMQGILNPYLLSMSTAAQPQQCTRSVAAIQLFVLSIVPATPMIH
jgi:hypothetical protein